MVVQHNIPANISNRYYTQNNSALSKSLEKLSSGYAINRAGDNAAGLAVSEKMRAQISGLTQASKNAEDGISMVQTYEGALQETDSILQRMRTIAVQSANGSYQNDVDRDALQLEFDQLNDELNQIADTDFNGVVVLNGGVMADGTIVNDTSKVAQRPEVAEIDSKSNGVFTYNSSVNGTVDSAGNGKLSVNGVSMTLKAGKGEQTLGSAATGGVTSYKTGEDITVEKGKASGTIEVNEVYKVDDKTTKVEIHGESFSLGKSGSTASGWGLFDADGNLVKTKDGLGIKVNSDSEGNPTDITLSGKYEVDENKVTTSKAFATGKTDGVATPGDITNDNAATFTGWTGNATVSGRDLEYSENGNDAKGKLDVNGADVIVTAGGSGEGSLGKVKYEVSDFDVSSADNSVSATIEASGTIAPTETSEHKVTIASGEADTPSAGITSYTSTDALGNEFTILTAKIKDGVVSSDSAAVDSYSIDGGSTWIEQTNTTVYGNLGGELASTADASSVSKITLEFDGGALKSTTDVQNIISDKGLGSETKIYVGYDTDKSLTVTGDKAVYSSDKLSVGLSNGLIVDNTGAVSGNFTIADKLDNATTVGTFKVSQGVSTSDAFNHGTANLTFADNMTLQVGARSKDAVTFNFSYTTNGIGNLRSDLNASARGLGTDQVSVKTQEDANAAIDAVDNAINKVSMIRGTFGAIQNRLEHKISNINTNAENLTAAESRIRDTQMDQEMMKFTSAQILSQASQSMLAQANSLPQGVLQLLG
jgi:flagellin